MPLPFPLPAVPALHAPAIRADLSTPEKTLATFCDAFSKRDTALLTGCFVVVGKPDEVAKMMAQVPKDVKLRIEVAESKVESQTDTEAKVTVRFRAIVEPAPPQPMELSPQETVVFQKTDAGWKVVAPAATPSNAFVNMIAYSFAHPDPKPTDVQPIGAPATVVISNVKQLTLGCLMLCQDYDEVFKISAAGFKKAVIPYVKNESVFRSPLDKPGVESLRFNPALANVSINKIKKPAQTVLIFEGEPGKPRFRYGGKAVIGYADGHAKLVTPDEAKKLLWKP